MNLTLLIDDIHGKKQIKNEKWKFFALGHMVLRTVSNAFSDAAAVFARKLTPL